MDVREVSYKYLLFIFCINYYSYLSFIYFIFIIHILEVLYTYLREHLGCITQIFPHRDIDMWSVFEWAVSGGMAES